MALKLNKEFIRDTKMDSKNQINLLQDFERKIEEDEKLGIMRAIRIKNIRYDIMCEFTCKCDHVINKFDDLVIPNYSDTLGDAINLFNSSIVICMGCTRECIINNGCAQLYKH